MLSTRAIFISLISFALFSSSAQSAPIAWSQAYTACSDAAVLHGYRLPRLCACVATIVAAAKPTSRAVAIRVGLAAAEVCYPKTGMN